MPDDTSDKLQWLRDDIKYLRKGHDSLDTKLDDKFDGLNAKIDTHSKECPAVVALGNPKKPSVPPGGRLSLTNKASLFWMITKIGPVILYIALTLIAVGAYLGGGDSEQVKQKLDKLEKIVEKSNQ